MYVLFAVNFLMVFICFTVLVPSTPAVTTKNNRQKLHIYEEKIHSKFHCCRLGCGDEAEAVVGFFVMRSIDTLRRSPSACTMTLLSVTETTLYGP